VLGSVEGLKRFVAIEPSQYHGLNFCQGTVSEMLEKPGEQIYDVIRWFGERQKIFNVISAISAALPEFRRNVPRRWRRGHAARVAHLSRSRLRRHDHARTTCR
jgi:hypothetical protein